MNRIKGNHISNLKKSPQAEIVSWKFLILKNHKLWLEVAGYPLWLNANSNICIYYIHLKFSYRFLQSWEYLPVVCNRSFKINFWKHIQLYLKKLNTSLKKCEFISKKIFNNWSQNLTIYKIIVYYISTNKKLGLQTNTELKLKFSTTKNSFDFIVNLKIRWWFDDIKCKCKLTCFAKFWDQ